MALTHSYLVQMWCEVCVTQYQLTYAREQAARIPELEKRLRELLPV